MAMNPYFIGEKYSSHPHHFGKSKRFFISPENPIDVTITITTNTVPVFASSTILPNISPADVP